MYMYAFKYLQIIFVKILKLYNIIFITAINHKLHIRSFNSLLYNVMTGWKFCSFYMHIFS